MHSNHLCILSLQSHSIYIIVCTSKTYKTPPKNQTRAVFYSEKQRILQEVHKAVAVQFFNSRSGSPLLFVLLVNFLLIDLRILF